MPMANSKFVPYEMKKNLVKIYGYDESNISGTLANPFFPEEVSFKNTTQLLKLIDYIQDSINFPQKSMLPRSFESKPSLQTQTPAADAKNETAKQRVLASFEISILFRQNASWQGNIIWMEKAKSAEFRSALEMIYLIDGVLSDTEDGE